MKALILYALFVVMGAMLSATVGWYVERQTSSTVSLLVFLAMFFSNFAVSWIAVLLIIDGTLKNAQGGQEQLAAE